MRWKAEDNKMRDAYADGAEREITRFLLFPKRIDDEYRWLELAKIRQKIDKLEAYDEPLKYVWTDKSWID